MQAATDTLHDLLTGAPDLYALVTSRERVHIAGEVEVPLGPLPPEAAGTLFLERARDVDPSLRADPEAVTEVCRHLSGLPLPLELAAAQLRYLPIDLLRERLLGGLGEAHTVVEEAVSWSVASLSGEERQVLAAASMFESGWELGALQAVCGDLDVVDAMGALADRSLISLQQGVGAPRWHMLDVVREFAGQFEPERSEWRAAYTNYYLALLDEANAKLGQERTWYRVLAAEEANIRNALAWAEGDGDANTLLALATGIWLYWQARGGPDRGARRGADHVEPPGGRAARRRGRGGQAAGRPIREAERARRPRPTASTTSPTSTRAAASCSSPSSWRAALTWLDTGKPPGGAELAGAEFTEPGVRKRLEGIFRRLAVAASSRQERQALVDQANAVRPRTWV